MPARLICTASPRRLPLLPAVLVIAGASVAWWAVLIGVGWLVWWAL